MFRALTRALEVTHERLHERLKPDETAQGKVFAKARTLSPAANANAQSIVIHSLHRTGAPGLDETVKPTATDPSPETNNDNITGTATTCRTGERRMSRDRFNCLCRCLGVLHSGTFCWLHTAAAAAGGACGGCAGAEGRGQTGIAAVVKFVDITKEAGIAFVHYNGALGEKLLPETMGAGVAFLDYDRDGDQDLFFVNSSYWPGHVTNPAPTQSLYRNDGKGHFQDVTKEAGLDKTFYGQGVAVGDYDNDNDPDIYVTAIGRGYLFRNDGKGHFEDVTEQAGAKGPHGWLTGAAFVDIENDGDLDLFICNYINWSPEIDKVQGFQLTGLGRAYGPPTSFSGSFCALLRNDGGRFTRYQPGSRDRGEHARPQGAGRQVARSRSVRRRRRWSG